MFCNKCGDEIADDVAFCSHCGANAGATPQEKPEEQIMMQGLCNRVKSTLNVQNGNALLTNKRFIYMRHSLAKTFVMGAFVNLTKGSYDFDIPIEKIKSIEDGRQGISKTILINTKDGEQYNFYFTKREEWKIMLQNCII